MAPGEMVLYESAKLLHGRPGAVPYGSVDVSLTSPSNRISCLTPSAVPMNGRRYENIFIHYQPESGWEDYEVL